MVCRGGVVCISGGGVYGVYVSVYVVCVFGVCLWVVCEWV